MRSVVKFPLLITLLMFLWTSSKAQFNTDFFQDSVQLRSIEIGTKYSYGSSVMNGEFLNKFIFGGKIERELKDKAYAKLSSNNRIGGDLNYNANVIIPYDSIFGKSGISLIFGLEHTEHVDLAFSSDLFKFTFDGNKQFAGSSANLGGTNYNYYKYQQINMGLVNHKKTDFGIAKEGVILSIIKGEEHEAITVPRGSIYTEELGKEIEVDLNYMYNSSDTANKGLGAFNGFGVVTDLFTEIYLKNGDKLYLGINDLGFIHWNKQSLDVATDSTFYFDGIQVDNIFDLNDSLLGNISKDSIINSITTINRKKDYSIALPTAININYTKKINDKWKINVGIYHKILSNYFPLIYSDYYYYVNPKFAIKAHLSYGGYGKLNTGMAMAKSVGTYFDIFIGTNNLEAFVAPNASYNNSGFIGVKAYF